jgi:hypothetical protein
MPRSLPRQITISLSLLSVLVHSVWGCDLCHHGHSDQSDASAAAMPAAGPRCLLTMDDPDRDESTSEVDDHAVCDGRCRTILSRRVAVPEQDHPLPTGPAMPTVIALNATDVGSTTGPRNAPDDWPQRWPGTARPQAVLGVWLI